MNLFTCTARVITIPELSFYKKKSLAQMIVCVQNNKKRSLWYYIYTKAQGKLAREIFNTCSRGDVIIMQGYMNIISKKVIINNNLRKKSFINLRIKKIYPIRNINS